MTEVWATKAPSFDCHPNHFAPASFWLSSRWCVHGRVILHSSFSWDLGLARGRSPGHHTLAWEPQPDLAPEWGPSGANPDNIEESLYWPLLKWVLNHSLVRHTDSLAPRITRALKHLYHVKVGVFGKNEVPKNKQPRRASSVGWLGA